jgi:hypothetical protein
MAKLSFKQKYEDLVLAVQSYAKSVNGRQAVAHSTTPQADNGRTVGVNIGELITIVNTAKILKKHVVLEVSGPTNSPLEQKLTINLVDQYPSLYDLQYLSSVYPTYAPLVEKLVGKVVKRGKR